MASLGRPAGSSCSAVRFEVPSRRFAVDGELQVRSLLSRLAGGLTIVDVSSGKSAEAVRRFGQAVRRERLLRDMSQVDLAVRSGLHPSVVFRVEAGRTNPRFATMVSLANGLRAHLSDLLVPVDAEGEEHPSDTGLP